jgi:(p)ppGpp synthase/HD superfamily hydrolase
VSTPNLFVHAVNVAALAFEDGRRDDSHELYLTHALDVAQALGPDASVTVLSAAVLHDVLEDTSGRRTISQTRELRVPVMEVVETLTRRPEEEHDEFVARICLASSESPSGKSGESVVDDGVDDHPGITLYCPLALAASHPTSTT